MVMIRLKRQLLILRRASLRLNNSRDFLVIFENSSWLIFEKLLRLAFGLTVSAWLARYLGPNQFGELAYVIAFIAFFQSLATLGLDNIVVRDLAQNKFVAGNILGTAFTLRLVAGLISWFLAIIIIGFMNGFDSRILLLTSFVGASLIFQATDTIDLWFQSQSQNRRTVIVKISAYLFSNSIKVALILNHAKLNAFAVVIGFDACISSLGLIYSYRQYPCPNRWRILLGVATKIIKESWPYILRGISIMIYIRIDQIMIKEFLGDRDLGVYAAVLPIATFWQFIPTTLIMALAPYIARKRAENELAYWRSLGMVFKVFALLGWLTCILTLVLAGPAIKFLFGAQYQAGIGVVMIYVFTNLGLNMGVAQSLWLLNEGKSSIALYSTVVGASVSFLGNLVLLPVFGLIGSALTAVIAQSVSAIFMNVFFSKKILKLQLKSLSMLWILDFKRIKY